ncbi:MAG: adenylosuccinate synthase [Chloroflexi bacterium]|nr:adenylosuccinate synthase [Chloroflexota bacterium]
MPVVAVVGGQWGDEGKGKVIDLFAGEADVVVRAQGGDNAGHTVVNSRGRFALHLVPAGIFHPRTLCIIGAGVALNPTILLEEMDALHQRGVETSNLVVSERAHLVLPYHRQIDQAQEAARGKAAIGTTGRGIGPAYADKVGRVGLRAADLLDESHLRARLRVAVEQKNDFLRRMFGASPIELAPIEAELMSAAARLRPYIADPTPRLASLVLAGKTVLIEGAHGVLLDLDYGTYPFVTASSPAAAGLLLGAGVGPRHLSHTVGVFKAYQTRVGAGPMPTELDDEVGEAIRTAGQEFGTTTGRPRRCGWFDAVAARLAVDVNAFDSIALTRLDILSGLDTVKICTAYELDGRRIETMPVRPDVLARCLPVYETLQGWSGLLESARSFDELPLAAREYVKTLEALVRVPIGLIGVGAARDESILMRSYP